MFSKKRVSVLVFLVAGGLVIAYPLFRPDFLAFQTRAIAVREACRSNVSISQTVVFTEKIEDVRSRVESGPVERTWRGVAEIVDSKDEISELMTLLRVYANAMHLSTNGDEFVYDLTYHAILHKLRNSLETTDGTMKRLEEIKPDLHLGEMESGEFDAILANTPFP